MKKILLLFLLSSIALVSCGKRHTRNLMQSGNYDSAIQLAVQNLRGNKDAKGRQEFVYILEEAFAKAKERDLRQIETWHRGGNPAELEAIYEGFVRLEQRQELIRPLLPLRLQKQGRNAHFQFDNYTDRIVRSRNELSEYLYDNAKNLLRSNAKMDARQAYDDFQYLDRINPNYRDVRQLMQDAHFKGTDFVHVYTQNETGMVIPERLERDMLDFGTMGLNDHWTVFHNNRRNDINYDFAMTVNFRQINISPEQIRERQFIKEKQIKDGVKNLLDTNGNVVRDSLGNAIKVDNMIPVRVDIYEFTQFKACQVVAKVDFLDLQTQQLINTFPLSSEFVFEHIYAQSNGDRRAVDPDYAAFFDRRAIPFPSNEQMVFDSGEDLKLKLKMILTQNRFRRP